MSIYRYISFHFTVCLFVGFCFFVLFFFLICCIDLFIIRFFIYNVSLSIYLFTEMDLSAISIITSEVFFLEKIIIKEIRSSFTRTSSGFLKNWMKITHRTDHHYYYFRYSVQCVVFFLFFFFCFFEQTNKQTAAKITF